MNDEIVLEVKNLKKYYYPRKGKKKEVRPVRAIDGVSFQIQAGTTFGLVGESGCGKTTIGKTIMRLQDATEGQVFFHGKDILPCRGRELRAIRPKMQMIFQDPMTALNPVMRIGNQIAEGIELHEKCSRKEAEAKAAAMLEMVGIPGTRFRDYPHQFSGGMKQRVIIAMALACSPDLLLADEPTPALDVTIQAQVLDIIKTLQQRLQTAMIMITHDLGIVAEVCDEVAVIYAGEIVEYGSKEEIFDHPSHPYTIGLFGSLPDINSDVERLSPIAGMPPDPGNLPEGCSFSPRCPYASDKCRKGDVKLINIGGTHNCRCIRAAAAEYKTAFSDGGQKKTAEKEA